MAELHDRSLARSPLCGARIAIMTGPVGHRVTPPQECSLEWLVSTFLFCYCVLYDQRESMILIKDAASYRSPCWWNRPGGCNLQIVFVTWCADHSIGVICLVKTRARNIPTAHIVLFHHALFHCTLLCSFVQKRKVLIN
ncbi:hypothetical protein CBL_02630 [Carabus blaptoides fortunei]